MPDVDASGVIQARRRGLATRFVAVVIAGLAVGLSWQPYGLWPYSWSVSRPSRSPLRVDGSPVPPACPTAPHQPPACRAPGSRALSRAKDMGSQALGLWTGRDSVTPRQSFALGYVFGLAMLGVTISWVHVLGVWIVLILIAFESLFFGLLGMALHLISTLRAWPLAAACCWVMIEFAYSRVPFGGFGWTRLAYAAVDTPLAGFLPIIGVAGVSFLVALIGQVPAWGCRRFRIQAIASRPPTGRGRGGHCGPGGDGAGPHVASAATGHGSESVNVGIVQGNVPGRGIEALGRMQSVTNSHRKPSIWSHGPGLAR